MPRRVPAGTLRGLFPAAKFCDYHYTPGYYPSAGHCEFNSGDLPMWGFGSIAEHLPTHSLGGIFGHQRVSYFLGRTERHLSQNWYVV